MNEKRLRFRATSRSGDVSAILLLPDGARAMYVLAHGAGAGMEHSFLHAIAHELRTVGIASLRYQFPYFESGRSVPDPPAVLEATVRSAVNVAAEEAPGLPLFAGGKSMGGRMTSQAQAGAPLPGVAGLVFLGFPLHPPKQPADTRAAHLSNVQIPMLFLQGTRDELADLSLLRPVCERLGDRAKLHIEDGADHSFHVLKRSGRTDEEVRASLISTIVQWIDER